MPAACERKRALLRARSASRSRRAARSWRPLKRRDLAELIALAALWGGVVPVHAHRRAAEFGPVALAALRVPARRCCCCRCSRCAASSAALRRHWRPISVVGLTNSALPFLCFGYAALSITAGLSSIFNAGDAAVRRASIAWLWLGDRLTPLRIVGLAIGFAGVLWLGVDKAELQARRLRRGRSPPACSRRCRTASRRLHQAPPRPACRRSRSPPAASSRPRSLLARAGARCCGRRRAVAAARGRCVARARRAVHRPRVRPVLPADRQRRARRTRSR